MSYKSDVKWLFTGRVINEQQNLASCRATACFSELRGECCSNSIITPRAKKLVCSLTASTSSYKIAHQEWVWEYEQHLLCDLQRYKITRQVTRYGSGKGTQKANVFQTTCHFLAIKMFLFETYPYSLAFSCAIVKQRNDTLGNDTWSE